MTGRAGRNAAPAHRRSAGVVLIDHLVGLGLALLVCAGASSLLVRQVSLHRQLEREAALWQGLRATHAALVRELRRQGHWAQAEQGLGDVHGPGQPNPFDRLHAPPDTGRVELAYAQSETALAGEVTRGDHSGFRVRQGAIDVLLGANNWQQLTDPAVVTVTAFALSPLAQPASLEPRCLVDCPPSSDPCASTDIRTQAVVLRLDAHATRDRRVGAQLHGIAHLRNDSLRARCAASP